MHAGRPGSLNSTQATTAFDERLEEALSALISEVEASALERSDDDLPLYGLIRYHLGQLDERFVPARSDAGKRIRPRLCVMSCEALGGDGELAMPIAAAIEMIHNFTLIHDDIQDRSELRRHRPTIWALWGTAQAINAGDALFALSHLMLNATREAGVDPATVLDLSTELHHTTLRIVEGTERDLCYEYPPEGSPSEYLTKFTGTTATSFRYALAEFEPKLVHTVRGVGYVLKEP